MNFATIILNIPIDAVIVAVVALNPSNAVVSPLSTITISAPIMVSATVCQ